jgi:hypothetical protein
MNYFWQFSFQGCGCGTALVAAQNLKRQWIGIDISPLPVRPGQTPVRRLRVAGKRMLWRAGRGFVVRP